MHFRFGNSFPVETGSHRTQFDHNILTLKVFNYSLPNTRKASFLTSIKLSKNVKLRCKITQPIAPAVWKLQINSKMNYPRKWNFRFFISRILFLILLKFRKGSKSFFLWNLRNFSFFLNIVLVFVKISILVFLWLRFCVKKSKVIFMVFSFILISRR